MLSSSKAKAKPSKKQLPHEAKVRRAGRAGTAGRGTGRGIGGVLWPIAVVVLIVGVVMAVGYWGLVDKMNLNLALPAATAKTDPKAKPGTPAPTPAPTPATAQAAAPPKPQPAPATPTDPTKAILDARKHVNRAAGAAETMLVTVYYEDGLAQVASLQPVEVRVPLSTGVIKSTAEQVVAAATDLKLYSNFPAGTKVLSVNLNTSTGVATVDVSPEASTVQGTAAVQNMQASLVHSLTAIKDVKSVQLWVNGRPALLHGIEWSKPISRADLDSRFDYKIQPVIKFVP